MFSSLKEVFERKNNISVIAGNPKKAVMYLFWPLLLSYVVIAVNGYLNAFWVTTLGAEASSAVNQMMDIYLVIASVGAGIGVACAVTISYRLGEGNMERARSLASHQVILSILLSVILGVLMYLIVGPLITLIGIEDLSDLCYTYLMPLILCNVLFLLNGAMCGILRAEGATAKSTVATMLCVTSAVFDPLFIVVLHMGIAGAAWGTIAGTIVSLIYLSWLFARKKTTVSIGLQKLPLDKMVFRELLLIGVPYSIQTGVRKLSNVLEKIIIMVVGSAAAGSAVIAIYALPWTYIHIFECFGLALGAALIPVMSYNIGRNNMENADTAYMFTLKKTVIPSIAVTVLLLVFAGPLVSILSTSPSLAEHRKTMIYIMMLVAFAAPAYPFRDISYNVLQTLRRNNLCVAVAMLQIVLKLAMMYVAGHYFGLLQMVAGNVVSNWIGGIIAYMLARHYWKRFDPGQIVISDREKNVLDGIEKQEKDSSS